MEERTPGQKRLIRYAGPMLLFLVVVLFYWKLILTCQYTWLTAPDIASQVLPWFQFQAVQWHRFSFPLWDPTAWFGQPLFGQLQPGSAYPFNWLLFWMPLKEGFIQREALHWYYVLIHYFAALSMYALCRSLGRSRTASIFAGCLYALGGYVGHTNWPQWIHPAVWAPLSLLFLFRVARNEKPVANSLLSGFFLGVGWLTGHHQMNVQFSLVVAGFWIWLILRSPASRLGTVRLAAFSATAAILTSGFQTIPAAEYARRSVRWTSSPGDPKRFDETIPYTVQEETSLKGQSLLGIFIPGVPSYSDPYIGIVGFAFGLLGVSQIRREHQILWFSIIALFGILFAFGASSLLHGLLYSFLPLVEKSREPISGIAIFSLGFAPLAAYGLEIVRLQDLSRLLGRVLWIVAGLLTLITYVLYAAHITASFNDPAMITALAAILASALLAAARKEILSTGVVAASIVFISLFEMATAKPYPIGGVPEQNLESMNHHLDLAQYVRSHDPQGRVEFDFGAIPYNVGDWLGLETLYGYVPAVPANVWNMDLFSPRGRDFFGIRYYFGKTPNRPNQHELFQGSSGIKIFENPDAYPRAWSVHRLATVAKAEDARSLMVRPDFDPRSTAVISRTPRPELESCSPSSDQVTLSSHSANRVEIAANLGCRGMVILTDTWYPGWKAWVDGQPAPIEEVDGGVRGVIVERGKHSIRMRYFPWSVVFGGLMTLLGACITAIGCRRAARS